MRKTRWMVYTLLIVTLAAGLLLASCSQPAPGGAKPAQKALIFGTQPIGTSTYVVGTGLGSVVEKYTGIKVIVQPMATTPLLYNEMAANRMDVALMVQGNSYLAFRGEEEFKQMGARSYRQLGTGNANAYFWVTRPDTGIKSIKDFVGKKVMYISAVSPPTTEPFRLSLEYNGVLDKVTSLNRSSMEAAAEALIEKKADVIGGPYGSFAYNVKEATGIVVIPLDEQVSKYIQQKRPDLVAVPGTFEAGYYALPQKMTTVSRVKEMTTPPAMSDDVAYAITKAVYDHPEDTKAIHRDVGEFSLDNALAFSFFIPTHPGAVKYYKEKNMWTKEMEDNQQKLLALEKDLASKKE